MPEDLTEADRGDWQSGWFFSKVLTKPPALCTNAAPATTSHSFLGVRVKVMSASPAETSASL